MIQSWLNKLRSSHSPARFKKKCIRYVRTYVHLVPEEVGAEFAFKQLGHDASSPSSMHLLPGRCEQDGASLCRPGRFRVEGRSRHCEQW